MIAVLDEALRGLLRIATLLTLGSLGALLLTGHLSLTLPIPSLPVLEEGSEGHSPSAPGCAHVRATRCS